MSFAISNDQELIRRTVREFAEKELEPAAADLDLHRKFPSENLRKMAPLGLLGLLVPPEEGGAGGDTVSYCLAVEEVARACATSAFEMVLANALVAWPLAMHAPAGLKGEWLPRVLSGEAVGTWAYAEEGIGRAPLRATASSQGNGFTVTGSKRLVANAPHANFFLVAARETDNEPAGDVPAVFLVPKGAKGVTVGDPPDTLGLRAVPLADVHFDGTQVPVDHKLGEGAPEGFRESWGLAKMGAAAAAVGIAQAGLDRAVMFAQQRKQFGRPIGQFEAVQRMLADMALETRAARALVLSAAGARDGQKEWHADAHAAQAHAATVATRATKLSIKVHGGAGFMREIPVERYARDVRTLNHFAERLDAARTRVGQDLVGSSSG